MQARMKKKGVTSFSTRSPRGVVRRKVQPPAASPDAKIDLDINGLQRLLQQIDDSFQASDDDTERKIRLEQLERQQTVLQQLCDTALQQQNALEHRMKRHRGNIAPPPNSDADMVLTPRSADDSHPPCPAQGAPKCSTKGVSNRCVTSPAPLVASPARQNRSPLRAWAYTDVQETKARPSKLTPPHKGIAPPTRNVLAAPPPCSPLRSPASVTLGVEDARMKKDYDIVDAFLGTARPEACHPYAVEDNGLRTQYGKVRQGYSGSAFLRSSRNDGQTISSITHNVDRSAMPENFDNNEAEQLVKWLLLRARPQEGGNGLHCSHTESNSIPPSTVGGPQGKGAMMNQPDGPVSPSISSVALSCVNNGRLPPSERGSTRGHGETDECGERNQAHSAEINELRELLKENYALNGELGERDEALRELTQKTESLARHLVKSMRERTELQERVGSLEKMLESSAAEVERLKQVPIDTGGSTLGETGWRAMLHAKERELRVCEDEIRRLRVVIEQHVTRKEGNTSQKNDAETLKQVQSDLEYMVQELGAAHVSRREAEAKLERATEELVAAQSHIQMLDARLVEAERAAMLTRLQEMRSSLEPSGNRGASAGTKEGRILPCVSAALFPKAEEMASWPASARYQLSRLVAHTEDLVLQQAESDRNAESRFSQLRQENDALNQRFVAMSNTAAEREKELEKLRAEQAAWKGNEQELKKKFTDVQNDTKLLSELIDSSSKSAREVLQAFSAPRLGSDELKTVLESFVRGILRDLDAVRGFFVAFQSVNVLDVRSKGMRETAVASESTKAKKEFVLKAIESAMQQSQKKCFAEVESLKGIPSPLPDAPLVRHIPLGVETARQTNKEKATGSATCTDTASLKRGNELSASPFLDTTRTGFSLERRPAASPSLGTREAVSFQPLLTKETPRHYPPPEDTSAHHFWKGHQDITGSALYRQDDKRNHKALVSLDSEFGASQSSPRSVFATRTTTPTKLRGPTKGRDKKRLSRIRPPVTAAIAGEDNSEHIPELPKRKEGEVNSSAIQASTSQPSLSSLQSDEELEGVIEVIDQDDDLNLSPAVSVISTKSSHNVSLQMAMNARKEVASGEVTSLANGSKANVTADALEEVNDIEEISEVQTDDDFTEAYSKRAGNGGKLGEVSVSNKAGKHDQVKHHSSDKDGGDYNLEPQLHLFYSRRPSSHTFGEDIPLPPMLTTPPLPSKNHNIDTDTSVRDPHADSALAPAHDSAHHMVESNIDTDTSMRDPHADSTLAPAHDSAHHMVESNIDTDTSMHDPHADSTLAPAHDSAHHMVESNIDTDTSMRDPHADSTLAPAHDSAHHMVESNIDTDTSMRDPHADSTLAPAHDSAHHMVESNIDTDTSMRDPHADSTLAPAHDSAHHMVESNIGTDTSMHDPHADSTLAPAHDSAHHMVESNIDTDTSMRDPHADSTLAPAHDSAHHMVESNIDTDTSMRDPHADSTLAPAHDSAHHMVESNIDTDTSMHDPHADSTLAPAHDSAHHMVESNIDTDTSMRDPHADSTLAPAHDSAHHMVESNIDTDTSMRDPHADSTLAPAHDSAHHMVESNIDTDTSMHDPHADSTLAPAHDSAHHMVESNIDTDTSMRDPHADSTLAPAHDSAHHMVESNIDTDTSMRDPHADSTLAPAHDSAHHMVESNIDTDTSVRDPHADANDSRCISTSGIPRPQKPQFDANGDVFSERKSNCTSMRSVVSKRSGGTAAVLTEPKRPENIQSVVVGQGSQVSTVPSSTENSGISAHNEALTTPANAATVSEPSREPVGSGAGVTRRRPSVAMDFPSLKQPTLGSS